MSEIQFGTTVIDETMKRTFTLTNRGALGTKFDFFKVTGEFLTHMTVMNGLSHLYNFDESIFIFSVIWSKLSFFKFFFQ